MVRTILTELQRIASHLLWLGTHALDIGALTPVFYCFREREENLKIFEKYCGARLTTHAFRIGGLQYETYDGFEEETGVSATISRTALTNTKRCLPRIEFGWGERKASAFSAPRMRLRSA